MWASVAKANKAALEKMLLAGTADAAAAAAKQAETAERREERRKAETDTRSLTHAFVIAQGANANVINKLYGAGSTVRKAVAALEAASISLGAPGTVHRDLETAFALLDEYIVARVKNTFGAIVTDGATFKHEKAVAILFESSHLPKPVLLDLIYPDADEVYDHKKAATDIRKTVVAHGLSLENNCTCVVGDNVEFNTGIARELGIARAKCLPHAASLVFKHGMAHLPALKPLLLDAGGLIFAGGTNKRAAELRSADYNLSPQKMVVYPNRFASGVSSAQYRLTNFAAVKKWHTEGKTLPQQGDAADDAAADHDADAAGEEEDDEAGEEAAEQLKRSARARRSYEDSWARLHLTLVDIIYGSLPNLIGMASGAFDAVPSDLLERFQLLRATLAGCATVQGSKATVEQACETSYEGITVAKKGEANNKFAKLVERAATASLASYDKHITPALQLLERRFRFDVRRAPLRNASGVYNNPKEFYGAMPKNFGVQINAEWAAYVAEWYSKSAPDPAGTEPDHPKFHWATVNNTEYWKSKGIWSKLQPVALFWKEFPTSSIAAERAFALGRIIDVPQRRQMTLEAFKRELSFRIHKDDLETLLTQRMKRM